MLVEGQAFSLKKERKKKKRNVCEVIEWSAIKRGMPQAAKEREGNLKYAILFPVLFLCLAVNFVTLFGTWKCMTIKSEYLRIMNAFSLTILWSQYCDPCSFLIYIWCWPSRLKSGILSPGTTSLLAARFLLCYLFCWMSNYHPPPLILTLWGFFP